MTVHVQKTPCLLEGEVTLYGAAGGRVVIGPQLHPLRPLRAGVLVLVVLVYVFLAFSHNKDDEKIQGVSADIVESRTMRIAEWSTEKVLVFLPQDMRKWVADHTGHPD